MKLVPILKRAGVTVVKAQGSGTSKTLLLRVSDMKRWTSIVEALLLARSTNTWQVDLSKWYHVQDGELRYMWRLVATGEVETALNVLGRCAIESLRSGVKELDSFPLVGRAVYPIDPARGLFKGAHDFECPQSYVSAAMATIGGGNA